MKKRIVALMLSVVLATTVTACGDTGSDAEEAADSTESVSDAENAQDSDADTAEDADGDTAEDADEDASVISESRAFDLNGTDYVTELCDYSAVPVTITGDYETDHEDAVSYLEQLLSYYGPFYTADSSKTVVSEGDIVNVDYTGTLDGEEFTGGTAEGTNIDVYNNSSADQNIYGEYSSFVDGFTDALKGASVGDVIEANVTFPEDYSNEDLAGQEVTFTFTVNSIQQELTVENVNDSFASEQFQVDTVDEMYEMIEEYLVSQAESQRQSDINTAVQEYLLENCTVEVPEDYLAARVYDYKVNYISENCSGDETALEDFLSTYYGKTVEEAEEIWSDGLADQIRMEFILDAVADQEGIVFDEDEYTTYIEALVSNNGYDSEEDIYSSYGYGDVVYGESYVRKFYVENLALDVILETAVVTEEPAESLEDVVDAEDESGDDSSDAEE